MTKKSLFGVEISPVDYDLAVKIITEKALIKESYTVTALAVHGLIEAHRSDQIRSAVNSIDLVLPDGQPVRWALNLFHNCRLQDKVSGPLITLKILEMMSQLELRLYLFGSHNDVLEKLRIFITLNYPGVKLCGYQSDRFRDATEEEDDADITRINESGANIILVGRGCPRQELWVSEHKGKIKGVMIAVGAAFDIHAGIFRTAPQWMQDAGLEWLFRLIQEPSRLWKRYLFTNSLFLFLFIKHWLRKQFRV